MAVIQQSLVNSSGANTLYITPEALSLILNTGFICFIEAVFFIFVIIIIIKKLKNKNG